MPRVDWNVSDKHRIYGNFFYDRNSYTNPFSSSGNIPGYNSESFTQETKQLAVNDTYTIRPNLLNEFTFSWLSTPSNQLQNKTADPSSFGINMPQYVPTGTVSVDVGGNFNLGQALRRSSRVIRTNTAKVLTGSRDVTVSSSDMSGSTPASDRSSLAHRVSLLTVRSPVTLMRILC